MRVAERLCNLTDRHACLEQNFGAYYHDRFDVSSERLSGFGTKCSGQVANRNVAERGHFFQMGQRGVAIEALADQPHVPWRQPTGTAVVFFAPQLELADDLDAYLLGERFQNIGGSKVRLLHLAVHAAKQPLNFSAANMGAVVE